MKKQGSEQAVTETQLHLEEREVKIFLCQINATGVQQVSELEVNKIIL